MPSFAKITNQKSTFKVGIRGSVGKDPSCNAGDVGDAGLIPGLGRSPGEGNGNLLQYSCLENPMDRGDWQATVHGVGHDLAYRQSHSGGYKFLLQIVFSLISELWGPLSY